jgi:hypothetical protein
MEGVCVLRISLVFSLSLSQRDGEFRPMLVGGGNVIKRGGNVREKESERIDKMYRYANQGKYTNAKMVG